MEALRKVGSNLGAARDPPESTKGFRLRYEIEDFFELRFCDFGNVPISDTCPKDSFLNQLLVPPRVTFAPPTGPPEPCTPALPPLPDGPPAPATSTLILGGGEGGFCSAPSLLGLLPPTFREQASH